MNSLSKLRLGMKEKEIDAVLVLDELNQRYLSNFAFTDGYLLITHTNAYLVTDFRYYEMAEKSANRDFEIVMPDNRMGFLDEKVAEFSILRIGFEGSTVSFAAYNRYRERLSTVEMVDIGSMIEELRQIKTAEEIILMQKAQDITDLAFSHVLSVITPEMTEIDVAVELEYAMRKNGADGFAFDTIAVSGDASALPHGTPRNEKLRRGFLTMDFGAKFDGYCSDMTRTIVIGKADDEMKKLYNTVLKAQTEALAYLRAGADLGATDKVARDIIDAEYKGCFGHSLGHSVGLFIHEAPGLSKLYNGRQARVGEIFTVEPGIYVYGKYGCRIEDMVAITEDGVRNFPKSDKKLIEIY